jgi:hypothetical protein
MARARGRFVRVCGCSLSFGGFGLIVMAADHSANNCPFLLQNRINERGMIAWAEN